MDHLASDNGSTMSTYLVSSMSGQASWVQTTTFVVLFGLLITIVLVVLAGWRDRPHQRPFYVPRWWPDSLRSERLDRVLFSADPEQQILGRRFAIGSANGLAGLLALNYGSWQGVIDANAAQALTAAGLATIAGLYVIFRSGLNRRLADPSMGGLATSLSVLFMAWGYLIGGPGRAVALMLLFVILMFSIFTSTTRDLWRASALAAVTFGWAMWQVAEQQRDIPHGPEMQLVYFLVLLLMLLSVSLLVGQLARLRDMARTRRQELSKALQRIQELATQDELTGLPNRRHMQERLTQAQQRQRRHGGPTSVALVDVDHFKTINDRHGHGVGDEVLKALAGVMQRGLRESDTLARWGGEEFLMLFPDTAPEEARLVLQRMQSQLAQAATLPAGLRVTFSAGVAALDADDSIEHSITQADTALYAAKAAGRHRVCLAQQPYPPTADHASDAAA
jgi:diguanylate cyclase (GGDEF)-like protein